ncbi:MULTISPECIES: DUF192 domain-containing protein [Bordetella]|uniref:Exported protein n=4 Tax=Bordetella pertussis TaxID=520 RepID=Q7VVB9_BORPE|nr:MULTISPECIES: DUF192 domain-containing protein [Bordetella]AEE67968.1 exported protein [Bordetella pertussis CS]AIW91559.1 hypothetical protein B1917_1094 [Bordetella pertussis B1917]AIW96526.1 hypothetical protein B1920_2771 [Bordetella pertussis B1920]AJB27199.1 hypothetical protein Q425_26180 [Bordetella pertussis 137]ALH48610.1 hypothetical protein B1838_1096 [Bordetella pertussis]
MHCPPTPAPMSIAAVLPVLRRIARTRFCAAVLALSVLSFGAAAQHSSSGKPQPRLPTTPLSAGIHIIHAEVADNDDTRRQGLMYRTELPGNDGMLFVFEAPDQQCFWMRNTPLPLSIAFIADDGTIVNIEDMAPRTDDTHCSRKSVRYALEMAQGWFARHGIKAGARINGLP